MKIRKIFCAFLTLGLSILLLLPGCYEDKGSYNYSEVNEVTIDFPSKEITILVGEPFNLSPTITSTMPRTENDYEYQWLLVPTYYAASSIYTNKKDIVKWVPTMSPGENIIVLAVTDIATGVTYYSPNVKLTIQNPMGKGIALITEIGGLGKVELMAYFNDDFVHYEAKGLPELKNSKQLVYYRDLNSPYLGNSLPAAQQGALVAVAESGAYRVNPDDLTYDNRMDLMNMVLGSIPAGFKVERIFPTPLLYRGYATMLGNDGNMYQYSQGGSATSMWTIGLSYNTTQEGHTFKCAPWAFHAYFSGMIIYNTEEGSFYFASDKSNASTRLKELDSETGPSSKFTYTGRDLLWMQGRNREGTVYDKVYALMKDSEEDGYNPNARYLVSFPITGSSYNEYNVTNVEAIRDGVDFCMTVNNKEGTLSLLYYRTNTKIYVYDFNTKTTTVVYETTGGRSITYMKFIQLGDFADNLMVCTYDSTAPTTSGCVEIFNPDSGGTGALVIAKYGSEGAKKPVRFDGFAKIVAADWKYQ